MKWAYEIKKERRLVVTTANEVSVDTVNAHQKSLRADPDFDWTFDQILDLTGAQHVELTTEQLREIAVSPLFSPDSRRAIVANSPETYGMARMFQQYRELLEVGEKLRVFNSLNEAYEWLGHPVGRC